MAKIRCPGFCCATIVALTLASTANAALYTILDIGDNGGREVKDGAETLAGAQDGVPPTVINSEAERFYIHLPGATMDTLSGSATPVGEVPGNNVATAAAAAASVSESLDASAGPASEPEGDTGWVEYTAVAATFMLFSPDGLDQESEVRYEPARVFLRRFADGSVYAMITSEDGAPPQQ